MAFGFMGEAKQRVSPVWESREKRTATTTDTIMATFVSHAWLVLQNHLLIVDPNILLAYQVGLAIGLVIITTLAIFPGKPLGIKYGKEEEQQENSSQPENMKNKSSSSQQDGAPVISPVPRRQSKPDETGWTPHQKLNTAVYVVLIAVIVMLLNHEYDSFVVNWVRTVVMPSGSPKDVT